MSVRVLNGDQRCAAVAVAAEGHLVQEERAATGAELDVDSHIVLREQRKEPRLLPIPSRHRPRVLICTCGQKKLLMVRIAWTRCSRMGCL